MYYDGGEVVVFTQKYMSRKVQMTVVDFDEAGITWELEQKLDSDESLSEKQEKAIRDTLATHPREYRDLAFTLGYAQTTPRQVRAALKKQGCFAMYPDGGDLTLFVAKDASGYLADAVWQRAIQLLLGEL